MHVLTTALLPLPPQVPMGSMYSELELALLRQPVDFGMEAADSDTCAGAADRLGGGAEGAPGVPTLPSGGLVQCAPNICTAGAPLSQVHMQFSVLGLERTYVTYAGRLLGVIRRSQLGR